MSETTPAIPAPESAPEQPASTTIPTVAPTSTDKAERAATLVEPPATASPVVDSVTEQDEGPEYQSPLTKKFTTVEWSALKAFQV